MKKNAFTLIELLVVVSIIIILIGLTSSGVMVAMKKAKQSRAKTEIMNILTAAKLYYSEVGLLPGTITEKCLGVGLDKTAAYGTTPDDDVIRFGPFYEFKEGSCSGTAPDRVLMDPWDQTYRYVRAHDDIAAPADYTNCQPAGQTSVQNGFSIVYSIGPDGASNTIDDIGTWQ